MANGARILVYPETVDVQPRPEVRAAYESLKFLCVWDDSEGRWLSVTVSNFRDGRGSGVKTTQGQLVFLHSAGNKVGTIDFEETVSAREEIWYDIVYQGQAPGDEKTFTRPVLLKPLVDPEEPSQREAPVSKSMKWGSSR